MGDNQGQFVRITFTQPDGSKAEIGPPPGAEEQHALYDRIYSQDSDVAGVTHGWIQWKGTRVCMDITCICGFDDHVDAEFFYAWQCGGCGAKYAVGQNIKLIKLEAPDEIARFAGGWDG